MSAPVPSPSMKGTMGSSGTTSLPSRKSMRVPDCGSVIRPRSLSIQQRPKQCQILPIRLMFDRLRRLQQFRDAAEALVIQQETKGLDADLAVADVLMPIDARAERLLRVIEMKRADVFDSDVRFERIDRPLVIVAIAKLVSRGEDVAGIETDADALLVVNERDDAPELLERAAEA